MPGRGSGCGPVARAEARAAIRRPAQARARAPNIARRVMRIPRTKRDAKSMTAGAARASSARPLLLDLERHQRAPYYGVAGDHLHARAPQRRDHVSVGEATGEVERGLTETDGPEAPGDEAIVPHQHSGPGGGARAPVVNQLRDHRAAVDEIEDLPARGVVGGIEHRLRREAQRERVAGLPQPETVAVIRRGGVELWVEPEPLVALVGGDAHALAVVADGAVRRVENTVGIVRPVAGTVGRRPGTVRDNRV